MKITTREIFGDTCYMATHPSGLKIFVYPKEGYASTYAMFGTAYGSIDTTFRRSDETETVTVPAGIAHFLEHKLFESEDGDAFARYAKTGASANAFTSFDKTCYLFSCTGNLQESLEILLDFVQSPYFTPQTVQKEQGIIGQEIRMYDDNPEWRVFFNLLGAMYHEHPVKVNIAGTVESIADITADLLYRCYRTFYSPANMVLAVAGKVEPELVFSTAEAMLKKSGGFTVERSFPQEPDAVLKERVEENLSVSVPLFQLGFKEKAPEGRISGRELAHTDILLELLASESSPLYCRLLEEGLINPTFGYEYLELPGCAAVIFGGESSNPDRVAEEIKKEITRLRQEGIAAEDFERARRAVYGRGIAALGNVQSVASLLMESAFAGREIDDALRGAEEATVEDIEKRLCCQMREETSVLSVIWPLNKPRE